jgi:hypothetical protein
MALLILRKSHCLDNHPVFAQGAAQTRMKSVSSTRRERAVNAMRVVIRLSARAETKALPVLLRHSPGMVLPDRTYVLTEAAVQALRQAGVRFTELSRQEESFDSGGAERGEKI